MSRKVYIFLTIATLLASTTGFHLSYYLCGMAESASSDMCSMCEMQDNFGQKACCEDSNDYEEFLICNIPVCCAIQSVDLKLSNDFIIYKNNNFEREFSFQFSLITDVIKNYNSQSLFNIRVDEHSPPNNIPIYITNSVLLI